MSDAPAATLRHSPDAAVLERLGDRDPLALAEACARTLPAAAGVARRLVHAPDVEATLHTVFRRLWQEPPPADHALEGWVRVHTFAVATARLRETSEGPAAPSARAGAPDLPEREPAYLDATERALAALDDETRAIVVRAHDAGVPSSAQQDEAPRAGQALVRGLLSLADATDTPLPDDLDPRLGDWVLGLLGTEEVAQVTTWLQDPERGPHAALVRTLRRGRRRIEGLPPTPDVGLRIMAVVIGGIPEATDHSAPTGAPPPASALHDPDSAEHEGDDLRLAAALDDAAEVPTALQDSPVEPDLTDATADEDATDDDATVDDDATTDEDTTAAPSSPATPGAEPVVDEGPDEHEDADEDDAPQPSTGRRVASFVGGLLLIAVGVALGLFVVGPLVVDWVTNLRN